MSPTLMPKSNNYKMWHITYSNCRRGYRGNALVSCRRGECFSDSECPDHRACFDYKCKDPCKGPTTSCGVNANCRVVNHASVCSCPEGYRGDPISQCFTSRRGWWRVMWQFTVRFIEINEYLLKPYVLCWIVRVVSQQWPTTRCIYYGCRESQSL